MSDDRPADEIPDLPATLSRFLSDEGSAASFLKILEDRPEFPGDAEIDEAVDLCLENPPLFGKALELCRLGTDVKASSRVRVPLRRWALELIRASDPELQDWARSGTVSPEGAISVLARNLREKRKHEDKVAIAVAEQVLRLGLVVTATWPNFDLVWSLSQISAALHRGNSGRNDLQNQLAGFVLRAAPKSLESMARLTRLVQLEADPLRAELGQAKVQLEQFREKYTALQQEHRQRSDRIKELEAEKDELESRLAEAEGRIRGVEGGADQDMIELRARYRSTLNKKLRPNVQDALESLDHQPPVLEVANHRIKLAERIIQGELDWLKEFLD